MPTRSLNATAASLLGFLHEGPMTGWALFERARERIGDFWSVTRSQVYRELAAMASDGLVEAGAKEARDRRPYTLTEVGRAAFAEWVAREPGPESIRYPLLLTMAFGRHVPAGRLAEFVSDHRVVHEERLDSYEKAYGELVADGADPYSLATLEFGLAYEKAVLTWFDGLAPEVGGSATLVDRANSDPETST
ncbi:MAG: PadR family transcriptional regulator [Actinomycetota bacterium]